MYILLDASENISWRKRPQGASKMAPWVLYLLYKPDDLSSMPETHIKVGENHLHKVGP